MDTKTYRLSLKSSFKEAEIIPSFVSRIGMECGLSDQTEGNLMLLLSEAVTNAIVHGNREDQTKKTTADIQVARKLITVTVSDEGEGFNPNEQRNPLEEENLLKGGGRGLFLIREIAESCDFLDNGTTLRFTLKRHR